MAQASFAPGQVIDGRYELMRPLGAGGMGEVLVARRLALGDLVAIKRLHANQDTPENRARFLGEARAAAHIQHPNVVRVFDFGDPAGAAPYLVMEFLDGPTLSEELSVRARLPVAEALELFAPLCAAIEAGHRRGVIHRDLKPANVILARADDGTRVVKVLDFGLALRTDDVAARLTSPGTIVGTVSYMSPEQVAGRPVVPASDVFALGVILYELVTGQLPFDGDTQMSTLFQISQGVYRPASERVADVPHAIDDAIAAALQVEPERRPAGPELLLGMATGAGVRAPPRGPSSAPVVRGDPTVAMPTSSEARRAARVAESSPRLDVFLGRAAELARLDDELRETSAGRGRIVVVTGDDGEGRSRLVEVFARRAGVSGALAFATRLFDDGQAPAYDAFARMLGSQSDARPDDPHPVVDAISARIAGRTALIAIDDVHLARPGDLDVIDRLARLGTALVLCTASATALRRESAAAVARWLAGHGARRTAITVPLRPFGIAEVRAWLVAAFGVVHVRPRDLRRLAAAAGGNPFFLAEVARHLVDAGAIKRRDDEWIVEVPELVDAPPTVAALVDARTLGLEPELIALLELAAAAGDDLRFDPLVVASGLPEERVDALLERAVAEGLLSRDDTVPGHDYRFTSGLTRVALSARMSPRARRRAHRRLLDAGTEASERGLVVRATHRLALDEPAAALADALAALTGAAQHVDADLAEAALARARAAVARLEAAGTPPGDADRARLDHLGGVLCVRIGRMGEARALLGRAGDAARRAGDAALLADVLYELVWCQVALGDLEGAIAGAAAVIADAEARGDRVRAARGATALTTALMRRGRYDDAFRIADELCRDDSLPTVLRARARRDRAWVAVCQGRWADAEVDADRALVLARGAGDPQVLWLALSARAATAAERGHHDAARGALDESLELARAASLRRWEAIALANLGEGAMDAEDPERALECFREALSIFLDIEDRACEGDCRVNLGRALLVLGQRTAAIAMLERGLALCQATGRAEYASLAQLHLAEARLADGDFATARDLIAEARQRLDAMGSHHQWRAEILLAQAAMATGDRERARYHARRAKDHVDAQRTQLAPGATAAFDRMTRSVRDLLEQLG